MFNLFMAGVALQPRCELLNGVVAVLNEVVGHPVAVGDEVDPGNFTFDNARNIGVPSVHLTPLGGNDV